MFRCKYYLIVLASGLSQLIFGQDSSVLSSGQWAKLGTTTKGIYKINYQLFDDAGFEPASVIPDNIRLYGQGGGMLPQSNSVERPPDLQENAIFTVGFEDGSFDREDYILFYSEGPQLEYVNDQGHLVYEKNLYSDTTYYFITVTSGKGKRMEAMASLGNDLPAIDRYTNYLFHESDLVNILSSGREWFGEFMTSFELVRVNFENIPVPLADTDLTMIGSAVNTSPDPASFEFSLNGTRIGSLEAGGLGSDPYDDKGIVVTDTMKINEALINNPAKLEFQVFYRGPGNGLFDFLQVTYETPLEFRGPPIHFRSPSSINQPASSFHIRNASSEMVIWDVTDPQNAKVQEYTISGNQAIFGANSQMLREYVAFSGDEFALPVAVQPVTNQDLHGMAVPDLLIVTHPSFLNQAEQLAAFRAQNDRLETKVVTTEQIYHEFSSGRQDVTAIRDLVRHLYHKDDKLKYLLLFGRSSFDYKNISEDNTNFVPTYQSRNSLDPIYSYNSDDYFGFLDEDEGIWSEELSGSGGHLLDIAVGRLPVTTGQEAQQVVNKLIHYDSHPATLGSWKKDVYYVADDGDFNLHQRDADQLATMVDTSNTEFNVHKIYMDAYPQEQTPNGESAEAVNFALEEAIKKGALIINYTGHGSEFRWAEETILSHNMINSWENLDRLPLFVTATCQFGRHDDPKRISGAEKLITNPKGGAIGLVTTARPVFASKNFILNRAFNEIALNYTEDGYPTLGAIYQHTKNDSYHIVANRNFALLGDPSMKLAYPGKKLQITSISNDGGVPIDTLKALSQIRITGEAIDANGNPLTNYQGTVEVTVYDKQTTSETLGSDGGRKFTFNERNRVIFRGQASINSGVFTLNFIVPKNINYENGTGKISLYALSTNGLEDSGGAESEFYVGGINKNAPEDNTPPEISLYMDDTSFVNGGSTGKSTLLLARLSDESGINIYESEAGQDITAVFDSGEEIVLNDFFRTDVDTYQSGWVRYPLINLSEGKHTVTLKAWDIYNNSSTSSLDFFVYDGARLTIGELLNYPNPFSDKTTFLIDHNQPGSDLEVTIRIFDRQGKLVHQILTNYENSPSTINDTSWDGTNGQGTPLENGIYLYQVIVKSKTSGDKNVENQKMILIK